MKLYIVRHGKPKGTESRKRYLGITDEALSDDGIIEADTLGAKIAGREGSRDVRIVSSPLARCFETALVLKEHLRCPLVEINKDLREIDMGIWDGRYFDEIKKEYPIEFEERGRDLWNYKVPEGESFAETGERFRGVCDELIGRAAPEDVTIVVSHSGAIRAGLSLMFNDRSLEDFMRLKIPYASAAIFNIEDGRPEFEEIIRASQ